MAEKRSDEQDVDDLESRFFSATVEKWSKKDMPADVAIDRYDNDTFSQLAPRCAAAISAVRDWNGG